jgi:nicotinamidase/pyrazinamidase
LRAKDTIGRAAAGSRWGTIAVMRALIVVDVQPTFCEGGELPVPGGNDVAGKIASLLRERAGDYALIVTTQDWHIDPGAHFAAHPDFVDSWPPHGVVGTPNAELHPLVAEVIDTLPHVTIHKGEHAAAYSGFDGHDGGGRSLAAVIAESGVEVIEVCGIAESHCVKSTALDANALGYPTVVLSDLTVPVTEELGAAARSELRAAGITLRSS